MAYNKHDIHSLTPRRVATPRSNDNYGREISYLSLSNIPWNPAWHYRLIRLRNFQSPDWCIAYCPSWSKEHLALVKDYLVNHQVFETQLKDRVEIQQLEVSNGDTITLVFRSNRRAEWKHYAPTASGFYLTSYGDRYRPEPLIIRTAEEAYCAHCRGEDSK